MVKKNKNVLIVSILTLSILTFSGFAMYKFTDILKGKDNINKNEINKIDNQYGGEKVTNSVPIDGKEDNGNTDKAKQEQDKSKDKIDSQKATEIISKYINSDNTNIRCNYDHMEKKDGLEYYVIQMYENMNDHVATLGWYYVEVNTGKPFKLNLVSDKLIPLE